MECEIIEMLISLQLIAFSLVLSLLALSIGYKAGFFVWTQNRSTIIPWKNTFQVFLLFISLQFFILPVGGHLWLLFKGFTFPPSYETQGWLNLVSILILACGIGGYTFYKRTNTQLLFRSSHVVQDVILGAVGWFIAYPCILVVAHVTTFVIQDLLGFPVEDQLAVRQVKLVMSHPLLLNATIIAIVGLVPIVEELLFRGYLQGACKLFFGKIGAIIISAACFTAFHFSVAQGLNNITILVSLFILAIFLGFLRERQGNLFASITLHMVFNAVSISLILAQN